MQRRDFAKTAVFGMAMAATLPISGRAAEPDPNENLEFTEADPGHWSAVAKLHVPVVEITGSSLKITTPHPMSEAHYIVSHTVVLAGGKFLGRKTFTYKDQPTSEHALPAGYKGKLTVTSTCNMHDFWVKSLTV